MEFDRMEALLEKYFEGETSIAEENELKNYFSSEDVAPHLEQYSSLFGYFIEAKEQKFSKKTALISEKPKALWWSIAASVAVLIGVGTFVYFNSANTVKANKELGTYDNPEEAFEATQEALAMLSNNVNVGVEGVQYLQVYEVTKGKVFVE
ncbi:hypothetical protein [Flavobacterium gilvum]|uniref:Uncharacterized protein n=1 Tax=Flavobacterium gilvum TaxID=1492737 RepID=A0AAC9I7A0_9FLAO|nr:hypothetical protein [Flavobacterium gilvum]AOW11100.1 hypothetical protein EM308_17325 [Flavobacterium gilvum]KFC61025.1 hypothetical protein FEM08_01470 [Flavobacterium gilvum]